MLPRPFSIPPRCSLALIAVVALSACDHDVPPAPAATAEVVAHPLGLSLASDTTAWSTFVVDVSISSERRGATSRVPPPAPPIEYRLERSLGQNGQWRTSVILDYSARDRAYATGAFGKRTTVARMVDEGDGSSPKFYDALGTQMARTSLPALPTSSGVDPAIRAGLERARAKGPRPTAPWSAGVGRKWIDQIVLRPEAREGRIAALTREFGVARQAAGGTQEYERNQRGVTQLVVVDSALAAPREIRVIRNGTVLNRTLYAYSRFPDGTAIRDRITIEGPEDSRVGGRRIKTIRFSNLRLEKRG
jgi:hypothetical protein